MGDVSQVVPRLASRRGKDTQRCPHILGSYGIIARRVPGAQEDEELRILLLSGSEALFMHFPTHCALYG